MHTMIKIGIAAISAFVYVYNTLIHMYMVTVVLKGFKSYYVKKIESSHNTMTGSRETRNVLSLAITFIVDLKAAIHAEKDLSVLYTTNFLLSPQEGIF